MSLLHIAKDEKRDRLDRQIAFFIFLHLDWQQIKSITGADKNRDIRIDVGNRIIKLTDENKKITTNDFIFYIEEKYLQSNIHAAIDYSDLVLIEQELHAVEGIASMFDFGNKQNWPNPLRVYCQTLTNLLA